MTSPKPVLPGPTHAVDLGPARIFSLSLLSRPGPAALILLLAACAVLLPNLGSLGLWDPHEVRLLEGARESIPLSQLWKPESAVRPRLPLVPLHLGLSLLGPGELGARVPMALLGLLLAASAFLFWWREDQPRAGLLSGLTLLTMPSVFLGARQASVHLVPMLGQLWLTFGLGCLAFARPHKKWLDAGLGFLFLVPGLSVAFLSSGSLVGVAVPALGVGLACALLGGRFFGEFLSALLCGLALTQPIRLFLGAAQFSNRLALAAGIFLIVFSCFAALAGWRRQRQIRPMWLAAALVGSGLCVALPSQPNSYSAWVVGVAHFPAHRDVQALSLAKTLGFALFPWIALVPAAFSQFLSFGNDIAVSENDAKAALLQNAAARTVADGSGESPCWVLGAWLCAAYFLFTLQAALVQEIPFAAVPAVALLVGRYLDRMLDGARPTAAAAVCFGLLVVFIARDFFFGPEHYFSAHLSEVLKWPAVTAGQDPLVSRGGLWLSTIGTALGLVFVALILVTRRKSWLLVIPGAALTLALFALHGVMPALTRHVSYRGIYTKYQKLGGGPLGLYGVQRSSARIYGPQSVEIPTLAELFVFLHKQPRSFAIVAASEVAPLDLHSFQHNQPYFVVDDSSSQYLLISNQLGPGEKDLNPLRRLVSTTPPKPQVELHATFDNRIELLGYDLPAEAPRGSEFTVRLYYRVLQTVGGNYRVFLHFDGHGSRINGDHIPLAGKYPTNYWTAGQYITDEYRMSTSRMNHSAGYYQVFTGFWPGGDGARLSVTQGPHEPDHRVRLSVLRVK